MYEIVQNMVLGKIQDAKGSAYTGICFPFFFRVEGKLHKGPFNYYIRIKLSLLGPPLPPCSYMFAERVPPLRTFAFLKIKLPPLHPTPHPPS